MKDSYRVFGVGNVSSMKFFRNYTEVADGNIEVVVPEAKRVSDAVSMIDSGDFQGVFVRSLALKNDGIDWGKYDVEIRGFNDKENSANDVYSPGLVVVRRALDKGLATFVTGLADDRDALYRAKSMGACIDMIAIERLKHAHAFFLEASRK